MKTITCLKKYSQSTLLRILNAGVLTSTLVCVPSHAQSIDANEIQNVTRALVNSVYKPGFNQFSTNTISLKDILPQLCANPSATLLEETRQSFTSAAQAFSAIELYRIGPMVDENRYHKIFYWPDSRNATERQLRKLLNESSAKSIELFTISQKSIAVQGLPALERLLFDRASTSELSESTTSSSRCQLALAVASNLAMLAGDMQTAWADDDSGISVRLLKPSSEDPLYRNHTEVLRSIMTQLTVGMEFLIVRKLKPQVMNERNHQPSLKKAPLWKSKGTLHNLHGNVLSLQGIVIGSGLSAHSELKNEIQFEFRSALNHLDKLMLIENSITSDLKFTPEAMSIMRALLSGLEALQFTLSNRLASELGVHAGFNSEDGD